MSCASGLGGRVNISFGGVLDNCVHWEGEAITSMFHRCYTI